MPNLDLSAPFPNCGALVESFDQRAGIKKAIRGILTLRNWPVLLLGLAAILPALSGAAAPSWVEQSNANSAILVKAIGRFSPEQMSRNGLKDYDTQVVDLAGGNVGRSLADLGEARNSLKVALSTETNQQVREDLQILIHSCDVRINGIKLGERLLLNFTDIGNLIFGGESVLLKDQVVPERRQLALIRLLKYTGIAPGTTSVIQLAKDRFEESLKDPGRLGPYRREVEQDIVNSARYAEGVRKLYAKYGISGGGPALDSLDAQLKDYVSWMQRIVLPHCRDDFRQPSEIYAQELTQVGLGIPPEELIHKAELEFSETQNELKALAPLVAKEHGFADSDYRSVVRSLKREQLAPSEIEPYYREVIGKIEDSIRKERIIALPDRSLEMRVATEAETAAQPSPYYQQPPLIDNTGERGQFILPLGDPHTGEGGSGRYDDFTFRAGAWTLASHEGRPGHDLQFSAMVERGVSQARSIFAFNSVNVEGWALYAEAEFKPYEPLDGQLIALQLRLLRAARAILDPMLNLGTISRERAHYILTHDVVLSEAFATEELDRFTFRNPGQATAYFYGYSKLMELRAATEVELGPKFDRFAFNNFVIGQGLLPPDLLAKAVETEFVPSQKGQ
jgi:hypothetical protein